jgi:predicted NUDIX family phosphoesterase
MDGPILVVPRPTRLPLSGLLNVSHQDFLDYLDEHGRARHRSLAEEDETAMQVIPYVVVRYVHPGTRHPFVLVGTRRKAGNEARLHNRLTLGFGGHVGWGERPSAAFAAAVSRELDEELGYRGPLPDRGVQAMLTEMSDAVGRVHLGAVMVLDVADFDAVSEAEPDKLGLSWVQTTGLARLTDYMERWALVVYHHLDSLVY